MRLLEISLKNAVENLALDEAILDSVEAGSAPDTLRLWESATPFVAIGSGQRHREVVHHFRCMRDGVAVLRRCSAGGAVLQGPGCLNFALAMSYDTCPETADLHGAYAYILERLANALRRMGIEARREGISDIAVAGNKVSGNAQRRRRKSFLHHGTLLYSVNHEAMVRYLTEPREQPGYRECRTHAHFVGTLPTTAEQLRSLVRDTFALNASPETPTEQEYRAVQCFVRDKYGLDNWNFRR